MQRGTLPVCHEDAFALHRQRVQLLLLLQTTRCRFVRKSVHGSEHANAQHVQHWWQLPSICNVTAY